MTDTRSIIAGDILTADVYRGSVLLIPRGTVITSKLKLSLIKNGVRQVRIAKSA